MRYVFDANFSPALPKILKALEMEADGVFELFGEGAKDLDWIPHLDRLRDILVTHDKHIRTRPPEAFALKEAGVTSLFVGPWWQGKNRWDQSEWLIKTWRKIDEEVGLLDPGEWVWVRANGDLAQESEYPKKARARRTRRGSKPPSIR